MLAFYTLCYSCGLNLMKKPFCVLYVGPDILLCHGATHLKSVLFSFGTLLGTFISINLAFFRFSARAIIKDGNGFGAVGNRIADLAYLAGQLKVSNLPFVLDPPSSVGSLQPRHVVRFHSFDVLDYQQRAGASIPVRQANWLPSVAGPLGVTLRAIWPKSAVLKGQWARPAIYRAD